jgi:hypothetical protein
VEDVTQAQRDDPTNEGAGLIRRRGCDGFGMKRMAVGIAEWRIASGCAEFDLTGSQCAAYRNCRRLLCGQTKPARQLDKIVMMTTDFEVLGVTGYRHTAWGRTSQDSATGSRIT